MARLTAAPVTIGCLWCTTCLSTWNRHPDARVTEHIDILPTVLDPIGYHRPFFSFGHSSVRREAAPYAATARDHLYLLMGDGHELY
ncbi:MAG: hypothetical protein R2810_04625 [Flavobacteriales bacterium]